MTKRKVLNSISFILSEGGKSKKNTAKTLEKIKKGRKNLNKKRIIAANDILGLYLSERKPKPDS